MFERLFVMWYEDDMIHTYDDMWYIETQSKLYCVIFLIKVFITTYFDWFIVLCSWFFGSIWNLFNFSKALTSFQLQSLLLLHFCSVHFYKKHDATCPGWTPCLHLMYCKLEISTYSSWNTVGSKDTGWVGNLFCMYVNKFTFLFQLSLNCHC